jgi:flagellar hook-associated protein 3 FlgL
VVAEVEAWFAPGGSFDTIAYLGSDQSIARQAVGPGRQLGLDVRADDARLREVMSGIAIASLADRPPLAGDPAAQAELLSLAGGRLLDATAGLATLRSEVGLVESELENVMTSNLAEETALKETRATLMDVDIFDAASRLENTQNQLQILYAITARSARLSLVSYLS